MILRDRGNDEARNEDFAGGGIEEALDSHELDVEVRGSCEEAKYAFQVRWSFVDRHDKPCKPSSEIGPDSLPSPLELVFCVCLREGS